MKTIGIDVGGTNTDAVLVHHGKVVQSCKCLTTKDVISGVKNALSTLLQSWNSTDKVVDAVMIGTTHFVNAVIQRKHIEKTAVIRISLPASATIPPFCDWPEDLAQVTNGGCYMIEGGHEYDGREIVPLNEDMLMNAITAIKASGVKSIAISSPFSTILDSHEKRAKDLILQHIPHALVTLSCEIGKVGLLERENVSILNSALLPLAEQTIDSFANALAEIGLDVPLYITQNDGTITSAKQAKQNPVFSFASGPTNSMRGAVFLSGIKEGVVCDVGGTTTDLGYLISGFPREANNVIRIGGVRTLFRMPDLFSIALGGGTIVHDDATVGPLSVGYELFEKSVCCGGQTLTATDLLVHQDMLNIGNRDTLSHLSPDFVAQVMANIKTMIEESVDQIKSDNRNIPLLAVGGGALLVPDSLEGISEVIKVENYAVANAVGAALAQISGYTDKVFSDMDRQDAIAKAVEFAKADAVAKGADFSTLEVIEVEDVPMSYMPGNNLQVKVKVIGDIKSL